MLYYGPGREDPPTKKKYKKNNIIVDQEERYFCIARKVFLILPTLFVDHCPKFGHLKVFPLLASGHNCPDNFNVIFKYTSF